LSIRSVNAMKTNFFIAFTLLIDCLVHADEN
jgi:hypothetical protein